METFYDKNKELVYRQLYSYDSKNRVTEEEYTFHENEIYTYYQHTYRNNQRISTDYIENWNGVNNSGIIYYDYDDKNNIIKKENYDLNGELVSISDYKYQYDTVN